MAPDVSVPRLQKLNDNDINRFFGGECLKPKENTRRSKLLLKSIELSKKKMKILEDMKVKI